MADAIDDGPEWRAGQEWRVRVVEDDPSRLPAWINTGLPVRGRLRGRESLAELHFLLLEASSALGLPGEVQGTARLMLERAWRPFIQGKRAFAAALIRGATVLHGVPVFYREIMEALGLDRERDYRVVGRMQLYLSRILRQARLWPGPPEWRRTAGRMAWRLALELGAGVEAARLASGLAEHVISRRDGTRIESAAAGAAVVAARSWGYPARYGDAARIAGVSEPTVRKVVSWLAANTTIRIHVERA